MGLLVKLTLIGLISLNVSSALANQKQLIAHSKTMQLRIYATAEDNAIWCGEQVNILLQGESPNSFSNVTKVQQLSQRLGILLNTKKEENDPTFCPAVNTVIITAKKQNGVVAFTGLASRNKNWQLEMNTQPTQETSPHQDVVDQTSLKQSSPENSLWEPPKYQEALSYYGVKDYEISTKDQRCKIRLPQIPPGKDPRLLYIEYSGLNCDSKRFVYGLGKVTTHQTDGYILNRLNGKFAHGFPIDPQLNLAHSIFLHRFQLQQQQFLSFYLGHAPKLNAHFIGLLAMNNGEWHFNQRKVIVVSNPSSINESSTQRQDLFNVTEALLRKITSNVTSFNLLAVNKLTFPLENNGHIIFQVTVSKDQDNWLEENFSETLTSSDSSERKPLPKPQEGAISALIRQDTQMLRNADFATRLTYLFPKADQLGNPLEAAATSLLEKKPISVFNLVHIDSIDAKKSTTDWPYLMHITSHPELAKPGWYLLWAQVTGSSKIKASNNFLIPQLEVKNVAVCKQEKCAEFNDVTQLVLKRYNIDEWQ
ncbi:hypothetical protein [Zooshikella harenae]|uniref:Uncharacterized protein n=1 Tax=Zooshikella harenae TaxID=2827238 RepID=A0ABS5ZA50_9GAMM|nr:hypothetical protein [Zooshikella harenae]MBU2710933.1 hypothetical protein [Zooshikella harenae]